MGEHGSGSCCELFDCRLVRCLVAGEEGDLERRAVEPESLHERAGGRLDHEVDVDRTVGPQTDIDLFGLAQLGHDPGGVPQERPQFGRVQLIQVGDME